LDSRISTPASISALESSAPLRVGRETMLVKPMEKREGSWRSSVGGRRRSVRPELWRRRQKRFAGEC
jgi:hypothetical protein